jgi:hypothetical protein
MNRARSPIHQKSVKPALTGLMIRLYEAVF